MSTYPFLSDEWVAAAQAIRDEHRDALPTPDIPARVNQIITGVPFGSGTIEAHLDTSSGALDLDLGHVEDADATVTVDYDVARSLFVELDQEAIMTAFLAGKIVLQGDFSKLLGLLSTAGHPLAQQAAERIRAITA